MINKSFRCLKSLILCNLMLNFLFLNENLCTVDGDAFGYDDCEVDGADGDDASEIGEGGGL